MSFKVNYPHVGLNTWINDYISDVFSTMCKQQHDNETLQLRLGV